MKNKFRQMGLIFTVTTLSAIGIAQNATQPKSAEEARTAVAARSALFKEIRDTYEPLTAMVKRQREIDPALVAKNAARLKELAGTIPAHYTLDTRQFKDVKSDSLDGIWVSQADFDARAEAFAKAADNAATVAAQGNRAATLRATAEIGKTCGACHDSYRSKS